MREKQIDKLPSYQSFKIVRAAKITHIQGEVLWLFIPPVGEAKGSRMKIEVSREWLEKHEPAAGGYFVKYRDGHESYSPRTPFEDSYYRISDGDAEIPSTIGNWNRGPANDGEGTGGGDEWIDGERLLVVLETTVGKQYFVVLVNSDGDEMYFYCDDGTVLDFEGIDVAWWARIQQTINN